VGATEIQKMPDTENNGKIYYHSRFRHGVDDKRRVQIPAKWRPLEPEAELVLIPWRTGTQLNSHLLVLPPREMDALAEKIRAMSFSDANAAALRRLIGGNSASVTLDKAGRICIPAEIADAVAIKTEAVLVGLVDRFEIWSPERYDAASAVDAALLPEAFKLI
jgi:transcriptional regulator MraZ